MRNRRKSFKRNRNSSRGIKKLRTYKVSRGGLRL